MSRPTLLSHTKILPPEIKNLLGLGANQQRPDCLSGPVPDLDITQPAASICPAAPTLNRCRSSHLDTRLTIDLAELINVPALKGFCPLIG